MKFIPYPNAEKPSGFESDDDAKIYLSAKHGAVEPPFSFMAIHLGSRMGESSPVLLKFEELEFMASALFGEARESAGARGAKWNGDAYRFAIYRHTGKYSRFKIVILRTDGSGFHAYGISEISAVELFEALATLPGARLWDLCMVITRAYESGEHDGRDRVEKAFVNGTLKKKKVRGSNAFRVSIEEPRSNGTITI